jgi:4'-phosphopantetheinyl transferase
LNGYIHVWHLAAEALANLDQRWLDEEEQTRANRFVNATLTDRYVRFHAGMRLVLSMYRGVRPEEIAYTRSPEGKPALQSGWPHFNLSHCGDHAVLAVAENPVGVDIEALRPVSDLWKHVLTEAERDRFLRMPAARRTAAFFSCWTRKEAVLKAIGTGLSRELKSTSVGWASRDVPIDVITWRLQRLRGLPAGMVGCVASIREGRIRQRSLYGGY